MYPARQLSVRCRYMTRSSFLTIGGLGQQHTGQSAGRAGHADSANACRVSHWRHCRCRHAVCSGLSQHAWSPIPPAADRVPPVSDVSHYTGYPLVRASSHLTHHDRAGERMHHDMQSAHDSCRCGLLPMRCVYRHDTNLSISRGGGRRGNAILQTNVNSCVCRVVGMCGTPAAAHRHTRRGAANYIK